MPVLMQIAVLTLLACGGDDIDAPPPLLEPEGEEVVQEDAGEVNLECPEGSTQGFDPESSAHVCEMAGIFHGPVQAYYDDANTQRRFTGEYLNGKAHGNWTWWHEDGSKAIKGKFKNDRRIGGWTYWYPGGPASDDEAVEGQKRKEEGDFIDDRKVGMWTAYYESGRKQHEGLFLNGFKSGEWKFYDDTDENHHIRTEVYKPSGVARPEDQEPVEVKEIPLPSDDDKDDKKKPR